MSTPSATCISRTCSWTKFAPDCAAPPRCVFLWLAIDARTKIVPVLYLGPRTQHAAHLLIHSLRQLLAAFLHPPVHQRWFELVLLCGSRPILGRGSKGFVEGGKCKRRQVA